MLVAVAQIRPTNTDLDTNLRAHERWIRRAAAERADMLFFPELSLTGYEPRHAARLALDADDARLGETDEGLVLLDTRTGAARGAIFRSPL